MDLPEMNESLTEWMARIERQTRERVVLTGESFDERHVLCPHCGEAQTDVWEWNLDFGGEWEEIECGHCEKQFRVMVTVKYSTAKLEGKP